MEFEAGMLLEDVPYVVGTAGGVLTEDVMAAGAWSMSVSSHRTTSHVPMDGFFNHPDASVEALASAAGLNCLCNA